MLQHITSWSYRHRWLVVVALGRRPGVHQPRRVDAFGGESKQEFLSPGTDSKAAVELLDERFPDRAGDTVTVVIHDDAGVGLRRSAQRRRAPRRRGSRAAPRRRRGRAVGRSRQRPGLGRRHHGVRRRPARHARVPASRSTSPPRWSTSPPTLAAAGVQIELSGQAIENVQSSSMGAEGPGLAVAALILLIAFGSLVAMGLPLATALFGVGIGLACGKLIANLIDVPEWASSVAIMIGLGVGIDYALLILTRYRSELGTGAEPRQAVGHRHGHRGQVRRLRRRHRRHLAARHADHEPALRPGRRLLRGPDRGRGDAGGADPAARADRVRRSQHRPAADPVPAPLPGTPRVRASGTATAA